MSEFEPKIYQPLRERTLAPMRDIGGVIRESIAYSRAVIRGDFLDPQEVDPPERDDHIAFAIQNLGEMIDRMVHTDVFDQTQQNTRRPIVNDERAFMPAKKSA